MSGLLFETLDEDEPGRCDPGLVVDVFAGGGGASTGLQLALGRSPDIALNHCDIALAMHAANHPDTRHLQENVWHVDPRDVVDRPVDVAWFSPDCKHHSRAKGGKPRDESVRMTAWSVTMWAQRCRPRVMFIENVEEFAEWGPLDDSGRPIKAQKSETFKVWVTSLKQLGYRVEHRVSRACDFGEPTLRKRLLVIARRDDDPIIWPEATHGSPSDPAVIAGEKRSWRTSAECMDWTLPCPSIFDSSKKIKDKYGIRAKRPLAKNTMARIAEWTCRGIVPLL